MLCVFGWIARLVCRIFSSGGIGVSSLFMKNPQKDCSHPLFPPLSMFAGDVKLPPITFPLPDGETTMQSNLASSITRLLDSPATRRLVREVLTLAQTRDIVDAIADLETCAEILRTQLREMHRTS